MAINLMPGELAPKGPLVRIANTLRSLSAVFLTIFILALFGLISFYLVDYFQLRTSSVRQEGLKSAIASLQKTEASLVLLRDRLGKIKQVLGAESAGNNMDSVATLFANVPASVSISDLEITPKKVQISVTAASSLSLSQFLATLISSKLFSVINLKSFSFNPTSGYSLSFEMQK